MASYDPYDGGDYTRPRPEQPTTYQTQPAAPTSATPTQQGSASSTPQQPYTPPANAGSWNSYYQQPNTTQAPQPYTMGANFQYNTGGPTNTQLGQYGNTLEGFESSKLNDPNKTSAKYMFGRLASRYAPTQQGFAQLMQDPEFQRLGMQSLGNGKIRLSNGDVVDVVRGFQSGGHAWQWGAETENGQPTGFAGPAQAPAATMDPWAQYAQQMQQYQQQQYQQQLLQQQQWQDYYNQMAAWQAQQAVQQAPVQAPVPQPAPVPTGYYAPPQQLPASPNYGGYGYNEGVGLQNGYTPAASSPYAQTFNYLAQGMPSPYFYG